MGLRVRNVQVDVPAAEHAAAVSWWATALGGVPRSTDEPEYVHLDGVRAPVGVHVQRLGSATAGYHLDLEADSDLDVELERLLQLGATDVGSLPGGERGRILADPASLPFCVTETGQRQHLDDDRGGTHLEVVAFDVPSPVVSATATFWAAAVGDAVVEPGPRHPEFTGVDGVLGPGGPLSVLVQDVGSGRAAGLHVDLHVADTAARDAEVERLVAAGATVEHRHGHWVVLRVPGDTRCCVVPDHP